MTDGYGGYTPLLDRWLGAMGWQRVGPDMIDATVERLAAETHRLDAIEGRAMQMYRHGSALAHLFAATVLGVDPDTTGQSLAGMRVDGTTPPAPPTPALALARKRTGELVDGAADAAGQVASAWRELLAANPDARHLGGPHSERLWAALDQLDRATTPITNGDPGR